MGDLTFRAAFAVALACLLALPPRHAQGQPSPGDGLADDGARPWAASVSDAEQAIARELYAAGNREFAESRFAQALAKYREAIQHWDHPAIRYNMAICLIKLDQPVEARDDLERSLAYGSAPLGGDTYSQGLTYRKLLDAQLAHVQIACREPGAAVTLDGKLLLAAPGTADQFVLAGEHQVVAIKPGFVPASRTLVLVAGKLATYEVPRLELQATTRVVRRWAAWKPWAVLAGGAALAGAGALSYLAAQHNYDVYNRGIEAKCGGVSGCTAAMLAGYPDLGRASDRAGRQQLAAFALFAIGGAAAATGAIGAIVNQPRIQLEPDRRIPVVLLSATGATVAIGGRF